MSETHPPQPTRVSPGVPNGNAGWRAVWRNRRARSLLMLGLLFGGLHLILLAILLPRLPSTVPLRMGGDGAVLLTGPPSRLFLPPIFGLLAWLTNGLLGWFFYVRRREPAIAYLLWGAALAVQLAAWLSLLLIAP